MPNATDADIKKMKRVLRNERRSGIRKADVVAVPLNGGDWLDRYLATPIGSIEARQAIQKVHRLGLSLPSRDRQVVGDEE